MEYIRRRVLNLELRFKALLTSQDVEDDDNILIGDFDTLSYLARGALSTEIGDLDLCRLMKNII